MAKTPTSYDPQFWSQVEFRGLDLFSAEPVEDAKIVAHLLMEYYRHSLERPTDLLFKVKAARQRKVRVKSEDAILEKVKHIDGLLESMYIEAIRDRDHTHAVASLSYNYDTIGRTNVSFRASCFLEDFDLSLARHLVRCVADKVHIDYGFSHCQKGLINSISFGGGLRILSDTFSTKRERWLRDFQLFEPRPSRIPFLDVFELNVLSEIQMSSTVAGRPFDVYVREKGRGLLEQVGRENFLWCLDQRDLESTKADLAEDGLVALT